MRRPVMEPNLAKTEFCFMLEAQARKGVNYHGAV